MHDTSIPTIRWEGTMEKGKVVIIDQTQLPHTYKLISIESIEQMWNAIQKLQIRGAPAIGIAAAFGLVLEMKKFSGNSMEEFQSKAKKASDYLLTARPTAVNLSWALKRMLSVLPQCQSVEDAKIFLWKEAMRILSEDDEICHAIGKNGESLIQDGYRILTHCNAGGLATSGYGTALAVIFSAFTQKKNIHVYADETRPLWQGARLTTWELQKMGIPVTLLCDNAAAFLMQQNKVDIVIVGADRIASNGDTANKIGTYGLALSAFIHKIPFYVAAPLSTFDFHIQSGQEIPIEERKSWEILEPYGIAIAPKGIAVYSPAFDITPAQYISGIITEHSILKPPLKEAIYQIKTHFSQSPYHQYQ